MGLQLGLKAVPGVCYDAGPAPVCPEMGNGQTAGQGALCLKTTVRSRTVPALMDSMKTQENEQKTVVEMDVIGLKLAVDHQSVGEMEELKDSREGQGLGLHSCNSFSCSLFK